MCSDRSAARARAWARARVELDQFPWADHDRLTVYQRALEFVTVSYAIRRSFPPGCQNLADQLERSTVSIVLNIAEGAGEFAKREKARFYRIARRSATETAAALDVVKRLELVRGSDLEAGKAKLEEIVSMLIQLAKRIERVDEG